MFRSVTITEIYQAYCLMMNLQQHQLRVAAVASTIWSWLLPQVQQDVDQNNVILACLLHDMGNTIKFNLTLFPEFLEPEGVEYWQNVKDRYLKQFGTDEHLASEKIAADLGVDTKVLRYIESVGFQQAQDNLSTTDWGQKICDYADVRVGPYGVITLEERFVDLRDRYGTTFAQPSDETKRTDFELAHLEIERQIQSVCTQPLSQLTDHTISGTINALKTWQLQVPESWSAPDWLPQSQSPK